MVKLAIVGSRTFKDYNILEKHILDLYKIEDIELIISGGAIGADTLGDEFAKKYNILMKPYLPDWKKYGNRAGMIRNEHIIRNADKVIAFFDGRSPGTSNSISIAQKLNIPLEIINY